MTEHVFIDCDNPNCPNATSLDGDDHAHWLDFYVAVGLVADDEPTAELVGHACCVGCLSGALAHIGAEADLIEAG